MPERCKEVHFQNKPVYLEKGGATSTEQPSIFMSVLAYFLNYVDQPVKTENAKVIAGHHLPDRSMKSIKEDLVAYQDDMTFYYSSPEQNVPETWILTVEFLNKSCLAVSVEEGIYRRHIDSDGNPYPEKRLTVDYQEGQFDGLPRLVETGCGICHLPRHQKI